MSKLGKKELILQLVVVDRYDYNEHSTKLMEHLRKTVLSKNYKSNVFFNTFPFDSKIMFSF
jgi:hypothetical protein